MRLFYALMPSETVIATLREMMSGVSGARWQSVRQLHLTLRFIGDVSGRLVDDLATALPEGVATLPPLALDGVGYFEGNGYPNALWVRAMPKEPLARLHRKLDHACQAAGLKPEGRSYLPHVTVARLPRSAGPIGPWIEQHAAFAMAPALFTRCSLVESIPGDEGHHYEELAWVPLD